ncbi:hypothetical protein EIP91_006721 [Steccherinum ochraceum]|uniref:Uncharacterized protein n=1 Tax=Steccherinum ochraceum TaxID=92696 RepID=A0A4R0R5A5_9APHY|nr:hypothetical protein EIP91_006721 [Steccherinum ochraceum]
MTVLTAYNPVASTSTLRGSTANEPPTPSSSSNSSKRTLPKSPALRARPRPLPNSYWATPYLVACEFPYCPLTPTQIARKHTKQKLDALLLAGVQTFIDLTEPHELFPYYPHLEARCALLTLGSTSPPSSTTTSPSATAASPRASTSSAPSSTSSATTRRADASARMIAQEWKMVEKCKRFPCSPETGPQFEFVQKFSRTPGASGHH